MSFYAVANGRNIGIFLNWTECNHSVKGYKNAMYKKFATRAEAENFIQTNTENHVEFKPDYYVYTDGACSNNGKENALSGIGIFFGIDDHRNISKKIEDPNVNVRRTVAFGDDVENVVKTSGKQTNNTAELNAIIETYYIIENDIVNGKKIVIVSDSEYAIKCVSSYGEKCCKNVWNTDIPNKELVKTIYEMYKDKLNIQFMHIKAHTNNTDIHSFGNSNADKLATIACSW